MNTPVLIGDMYQDEHGEVYVYTGSEWRRVVTPEKLAVEQEQEPVACIIHTEEGDYVDWNSKGYCFYIGETPLYAAPVRTVDLTDDEIYTLYSEPCSDREMIEFARAVISAFKEKNK